MISLLFFILHIHLHDENKLTKLWKLIMKKHEFRPYYWRMKVTHFNYYEHVIKQGEPW